MFLDSRQGQGFVFTNLKGNGEAADGGEGANPFLQRGIPFTNESGEKKNNPTGVYRQTGTSLVPD